MQTIKIFFSSVVVLAIFDLLWVGVIANSFYNKHLHDILRLGSTGNIQARLIPVIFIYIAMASLLTFFVLLPGGGFVKGAFLGLLVYAFYNFTNLALLREYSLTVTIVDTIWGAFMFGISSFIISKFLS